MSYKLGPNGVIRISDGASIPSDPKNTDWRDYLAWVAKGNTPAPERTLAEAKARQSDAITVARNRALSANGATAEWNGEQWDADELTWLRIGTLVPLYALAMQAGKPVPPVIPWRTLGNANVELTFEQANGLMEAITDAYQAVWTKQAALKDQIEAARNIAEVEAVRW
jgi:hypothetical protein